MIRRRTLGTPWACTLALLGATTLTSTLAFVGCSSEPNSAAKNQAEGQVQVVALGLSQADISAVTVTVTGGPAGAGTTTVNLTKNADGTWSGTLAGLPVGSGYVFTMTATSNTGTVIYQGTASSVAVTQNHTSAARG